MLSIFQNRAFSGAVSRAPTASEVTGVRVVTQALPWGFAGPGATGTESISTTVLAGPSTVMSSRTQKKCWWFGP